MDAAVPYQQQQGEEVFSIGRAADDHHDNRLPDYTRSDTGRASPLGSSCAPSPRARGSHSRSPSSVYSVLFHDQAQDLAVDVAGNRSTGTKSGDATTTTTTTRTAISDALDASSLASQIILPPLDEQKHQEQQEEHHKPPASVVSATPSSTPARRARASSTRTITSHHRFSVKRKPLSPTSPIRVGTFPEFQPFSFPESPPRRDIFEEKRKGSPPPPPGQSLEPALPLSESFSTTDWNHAPDPPGEVPVVTTSETLPAGIRGPAYTRESENTDNSQSAPPFPNTPLAVDVDDKEKRPRHEDGTQPGLVIEHFYDHRTDEEDVEVTVFDSVSNYTAATTTHDDSALYEQEKPAHPQPTGPATNPATARAALPHLNLKGLYSPQLPAINAASSSPPRPSRSPTQPAQLNKPLPKSPGSPSGFGAYFNWTASPSPSPAPTEFSFNGSAFIPQTAALTDESPVSTTLESHNPPHQYQYPPAAAAAKSTDDGLVCADAPPATTYLPPSASSALSVPASVQIEEMEDELKGISSELAASIRREMDLEDLVDRLQAERDNFQPGKRTSDYFSDSGVSSTKFGDYDQSRENVERIQRKAGQDMAQLRLDLTAKLQDERARRMALDRQIQELSQKASRVDLAQLSSSQESSGRVRELERSCEELRRKFSEERDANSNFETLLSALRGDLQGAVNERDNLRDEIVPSLRARLEGLEAQSSEYATLTYESTKMQQEIQSLRDENDKLRSDQATPAAAAILVSPPPLQRSNSTMDNRLKPKAMDLSRSNSVQKAESREALAERLKDVESQRNALHVALKSLLDRQEYQNRENEKRIKTLEVERDRLLATSPRVASFEKEVSNLRAEIKMLRRRAEEALEQKWQVEKGLGGLKMDLDRAEEDIRSLKALLKEADVPIPPTISHIRGSSGIVPVPVMSGSLTKTYQDVQAAYADALRRITMLEADSTAVQSEMSQLAIRRLERTLTAVITERDEAQGEAGSLKEQLDALGTGDGDHIKAEHMLADELQASVARVEELAGQVRQQLATNATLRSRLAEMIARGDSDRKSHIERISTLQSRMRLLEEHLVAAQNASEDRIARHEAEIAAMREGNRRHLRRAHSHSPSPSPSTSQPRTPLLSPMASPRFAPLRANTVFESYDEERDEEAIVMLRSRVLELEALLHEAESGMQEVVNKMSAAQIEVMMLREEKEDAERETRKLQRVLEDESNKSFEDRFRSLGSLMRG